MAVYWRTAQKLLALEEVPIIDKVTGQPIKDKVGRVQMARLTGDEKHLLVTYSIIWDENGKGANPTISHLVKKMNKSESTIHRALRRLRQYKILIPQKGLDGSSGPTTYDLVDWLIVPRPENSNGRYQTSSKEQQRPAQVSGGRQARPGQRPSQLADFSHITTKGERDQTPDIEAMIAQAKQAAQKERK